MTIFDDNPHQAPYALPDDVLLAACDQRTSLSGGPGGQHANKNASAVMLVHRDSELSSQCMDFRERQANKKRALRQLRLRLACHLRGVAHPAWLQRFQRGTRIHAAPDGAHFHLVIGVLLDALQQAGGRPAAAAAQLGLSTSQFTRCLAQHKDVVQAARGIATEFGVPPLRT